MEGEEGDEVKDLVLEVKDLVLEGAEGLGLV